MSTLEELERRLQLLEDKEGIRECLARYTFNKDLGRSEEYARNFTPDGVLDVQGTRAEGYDQILAFATNPRGQRAIENRCTHNTVNLFIRVNGDKAWAEGYQIVLVKDQEGDERRILSMGLNHWTFEKHDGRWYIKERVRREAGGKDWPGEIVKSYLEA